MPAPQPNAWGLESTSTFVHSGDPNGAVTSKKKGDLCVDFATPALYQADADASTSWTAIGGGGGPSTFPVGPLDDATTTYEITAGSTLLEVSAVDDSDSDNIAHLGLQSPVANGGTTTHANLMADANGGGQADLFLTGHDGGAGASSAQIQLDSATVLDLTSQSFDLKADDGTNTYEINGSAGTLAISNVLDGGGFGPVTVNGSPINGGAIVRKFPFAFNDLGLAAGKTIYTPTAGDILLDCWVQIDTAWDGTTPFGEVGTFVGANTGLFALLGAAAPLDMTVTDTVVPGFGEKIGIGTISGAAIASLASVSATFEATGVATPFPISIKAGLASDAATSRLIPAFLGADPIKVCVSQTGQAGGADPGSTQGAGVVYLVTATPV